MDEYSPLEFVFKSIFLPVSASTNSTVAPSIGLPVGSLTTPFTAPVPCAHSGTVLIPSRSASNVMKLTYFFIIFPPARETASRTALLTCRSPLSILRYKFTNDPGPQPATDKKRDRARPLLQKHVAATRNCRNCHKPGPPGCSMTTLNRRERPIQGQASQSQVCESRSAASQCEFFPLSFLGVSLRCSPSSTPGGNRNNQ